MSQGARLALLYLVVSLVLLGVVLWDVAGIFGYDRDVQVVHGQVIITPRTSVLERVTGLSSEGEESSEPGSVDQKSDNRKSPDEPSVAPEGTKATKDLSASAPTAGGPKPPLHAEAPIPTSLAPTPTLVETQSSPPDLETSPSLSKPARRTPTP